MTLLDNMPHRVTWKRPRWVSDNYGGNYQDETNTTTIASEQEAWVQNATMREIEQYDKRDEVITHKVFMATNPGLQPGDIGTVDSGPSFVGETLEYRASTDRSAGLGALQAAMCKQRNNKRR